MTTVRPRILIVGAGSIGRRHLGILKELGSVDLAVCEPDAERLRPAVAEHGVPGFESLESALGEFAPAAVLVCTPPVLHIEQARQAVAAGADVFIEKPLSASLDGVAELEAEAAEAGRIVQVGYNLHFERSLRHVKQLVDEGAVGRILWARIEFGQYLPDWRPWQDYRISYTARRELGGGILLDASHELAYAIWLLGEPVEAVSLAGRVSALDVDVEDCATVLLRFAGGAQADIHVDFVQRVPTRSCTLAGENGTIDWDALAHTVRIRRPGVADRFDAFPTGDNDAYRTELVHFLDCVAHRREPQVGLGLGRLVLELALDAGAGASVAA